MVEYQAYILGQLTWSDLLSDKMWNFCLAVGNPEAEDALKKFADFLEKESQDGKMSPQLQKKVLGKWNQISIVTITIVTNWQWGISFWNKMCCSCRCSTPWATMEILPSPSPSWLPTWRGPVTSRRNINIHFPPYLFKSLNLSKIIKWKPSDSVV